MGKITVGYEMPQGHGVDAFTAKYPIFIAHCCRIAEAIGDRVGPISVRFIADSHARAEIAWRNEVFAECRPSGIPDGEPYADRIHLSDPRREVYRGMMYTVDEAIRELPVLLGMLLQNILRKHELRVRAARAALDTIEPGHPPGLARQ